MSLRRFLFRLILSTAISKGKGVSTEWILTVALIDEVALYVRTVQLLRSLSDLPSAQDCREMGEMREKDETDSLQGFRKRC